MAIDWSKFPSEHAEVTVKWCERVHRAAWEGAVNDRKLTPIQIEMLIDALGYVLTKLPEDEV